MAASNQTNPALPADNQQGPDAFGAGSPQGSDNYEAKEQGKGLYGQYGLGRPGHQGYQANAEDQGNKDSDAGKAAVAHAAADVEPPALHSPTGEEASSKPGGTS
ncbi:MAG: hypothetical protein JWQ72_1418 [Polaromonas sp.]|nr:hypothetical protein [Polaromonas sp.]